MSNQLMNNYTTVELQSLLRKLSDNRFGSGYPKNKRKRIRMIKAIIQARYDAYRCLQGLPSEKLNVTTQFFNVMKV